MVTPARTAGPDPDADSGAHARGSAARTGDSMLRLHACGSGAQGASGLTECDGERAAVDEHWGEGSKVRAFPVREARAGRTRVG